MKLDTIHSISSWNNLPGEC